jgi:AmmeMemoRadiSam system protein B
MIREPAVAGLFYPGSASACREEAAGLLEGDNGAAPTGLVYGGLVPHAGWTYSGATTAKVFHALTAARPEVIVLFGGVHRYRGRQAAMFSQGRWETPVGPFEVDARLAERIAGHTNMIVEDPYAHEHEHSIEVQLPLLKLLFPDARIVPIMVPPIDDAHKLGAIVARTLKSYDYEALIIGTTDLTHYGPQYGFVTHGVGEEANAWAKNENDKRFIAMVRGLKGESVVAEARDRRNACSSGAVAATLGAVQKLGATEGVLLEHTTSSEVMHRRSAQVPEDSVGYAGFVFV